MKEKKKGMATNKEILGHALGGVGQNLIYALWSGYIMMFYTDVFGLGAGFVGSLFLGARIWDAVNDPMMGMIADRTKSKYGRFRVWLKRMPIVVGVCLVLNFTVPGSLSGLPAMIFAAITYILMGMAFTSIDIPYWSLPAAMTSNTEERTKIFSFSSLGTNLASTVAGIIIVPLIGALGQGNQRQGFFLTAIVFAVLGCIFYFICFAMVREHVEAPVQKFNFKLALQSLTKNKPLMMVMLAGFSINLAFITKMTLNTYYTRYTLNNFNLMSIMSLISLPAILLGTVCAPILCKKLGKRYSIIVLNVVNLLVGIAFFISGYTSIPLVIFFSAVQGALVGAAFVVINSMTADTIEYAEWLTGQRNDAVITSTRTLITKFASSITGIVASAVLIFANYQPNIEQTLQTRNIFHAFASLVPGVAMMLGTIPMFFYPLTEKKHAEIVIEIEKRKGEK